MAETIEATVSDKEKVKKMSKTNAKSLNGLKQNIKKNNANYEAEIKKYLENPEEEEAEAKSESEDDSGSDSDSSSSGSSSGSDSDSDDDDKKKKKEKPAKTKGSDDEDDDDDDDSIDWGSDSTSSSSDSDTGGGPAKTGLSKWMKTGDGSDSDSDDGFEKVAKKKKERVQGPGKKKQDDDDKPKQKEEVQMVLNEENVKKKLDELMAQRGKRGTSKKDQIAQLEHLSTATIPPVMSAMVLVHLIAAQFDTSMTRQSVAHMPISFEVTDETTNVTTASRANCLWTKCMHNVRKLLLVLRENPELTEEATGQQSASQSQAGTAGAPSAEVQEMIDDDEPLIVAQNLVSFVERLDDELYLSLRLLDNHSSEFLKRLQDIAPLLSLAQEVQDYYENLGNNNVAARLAMRRLEHLYYKHDDLIVRAATKCPQVGDQPEGRQEFINKLAMKVYRYGDAALHPRAMLCQMYYHALHDRFFQARDMLLMSRLQENIHQYNSIPLQILFNRVMAQMGLSAFRNGLVVEAHGCFDELCGNNRLKELLAQGLSSQRFNDRSQEQERMEKKRQTPYHMHLNLELIECCHLVGAILIEIPKMVANAFDSKRKLTSRALKRVFDNSDRNPLSGPPETTRDVIMAGARALEKGDWEKCENYVLALPVWTHLGSEECVSQVKATLQTRIKEEALRTFLFAYSAYYEALSLDQLCEMFALEKKVVNTLVSKMIISEELFASWDQPTGSIVMHKKERSRLHHMALHYSDNLAKLVESNEKAWDMRFGGYDFKQHQGGRGGWFGGGGRGGGRGGGPGNRGGDRRDGDRGGRGGRGGYDRR
eukprot:GHVU01070420.1.p1 GENE.GHVU01070420.1~~GHVU01070420.1.p1  ORF type:complete len:887 (-),score=264.92 GHVU01070420.1:71-2533(-)